MGEKNKQKIGLFLQYGSLGKLNTVWKIFCEFSLVWLEFYKAVIHDYAGKASIIWYSITALNLSLSFSLSSYFPILLNCYYGILFYYSNYVPTTQPTTVSYTINKCSAGIQLYPLLQLLLIRFLSADICRIRLDYDLFVLTAPNAVQATQGQCDTDVMTVRDRAHNEKLRDSL